MNVQAQALVRDYGLLACNQCGKCTGGCPLAIKSPLNVRDLIYRTILNRDGMDISGLDELWHCSTCWTCVLRCPKEVKPAELIIGMRSALVENGRIPQTVSSALRSVYVRGNPLTFPRENRTAWLGDLSVKDVAEGAEVLYHVGCVPSYDARVQKVARAMVRTFDRADVDFGILGTREICCGSDVRRLGEAGLFEMVQEDNQALWADLSVKRMVTTSPHCFHTFRNEYPPQAFEVQHYTQFIAGLTEAGKLSFSGRLEQTVTYHDPCYLGKQNGIYDEPREILKSIPGLKLVEMDRSRENSLCCEGGGGRMFVEDPNPGKKLAHMRIEQALSVGAQIIAVACPFCMSVLEDAVRTGGHEEEIRVMDIMELVALVL